MKKLLLFLPLQLIMFCAVSQTSFIPYGSVWKYFDKGTNQGTAWRAVSFNDVSWAIGPGQLGYGDGDEATVVGYGNNSNKKYITTYFRKAISISQPATYTNFVLGLKRDDGAVVYINGTEAFRSNMPTGTISYTTTANLATDDGNTEQSVTLPVSLFTDGSNTIAVEIHQYKANDPDISFDIKLVGNKANTPPVANAGADQTITLPTNSVSLNGSSSSDADGTISTYAWSKFSGPASGTITNSGSVSATATGLVQGIYIFRLAVTDNNGATATDDVIISVNSSTVRSTYNVIDFGNIWKYLDNGSNQGTAWQAANFADGSWASGPGQLGYGDGDEATVVSYGTDPNHKYITTYFRKVVNISNPPDFLNFTLNVKRDDGIVVYVNGIEVYRNLMTTGTITYTTLSSSAASDDGNVIQTATFASSSFVNGNNTIAVEIHQNAVSNSDISFDLQLIANASGQNVAPVANAGPDQTITLPTNSVSLNGSGSSDVDGTISTYAWSKFSGPASGTITSPGSVNTTVTGLVAGTYIFRLTVTDNSGATATNDVTVIVNQSGTNIPPVANAGADQTITLPTNSVSLNGSGSSDADGTISTYAWSKFSGPASGTITTPGSVSTTVTGLVAGTYIFRLTVTDNGGATATNDMTVIVNPAATNTPPVANAGADQTITLPTSSVSLSGSGSSDADGTISTYAWSKFSGPASGTITTPGSVSTTVTGLVAGTYVFRLTVTDNSGATATNDMTVIVNASTGSVTLIQGPYLQMANGSAVTLRWRTDKATDSKISVGTTSGTYTISATNSTSTTEHEVRITGLSADTKYYYSFGSSSQTLQAGTSNFFNTAPPANTTRKIRVAAFGDCGTNANNFQSGTLSSYQAYVGSNPAELMLLLGDNAYSSGTDGEYTSKFFNIYSGNILKNHVLFPAPGNHDYASSSSRQADHNIPYYSLFTMPKAGECGGLASGTEAFYSYNWGNIHFLSLDSYGFETGSTRLYDTLGPQVTWIKKDLAANTGKWTIAYWHHPPYTMGSHNSDTESELVKMRQNFIRILERYGVDMVLCGHSHDYERSYLLKGYYGNEASFSLATHAVSSSSARYDGTTNSCPYNVPSGIINHGTVYVVAGSAGNDGGVQTGYPHNAMPFSVDDGGLLYFEVEGNRLDAKFIRRDGVIADKFTILKDAGKTTTVSITSGQSTTLTASWKGNYSWSTGATTQSITVSPTTTKAYTCTDGSSCIIDNFTVNVTSALKKITLAATDASYTLNAYPTPVKKGNHLTITSENSSLLNVSIFNDKGQKIKQLTMQGTTRMNTADMRSGIYYLRTEIGGKKVTRKIMVTD